MPERVTILLGMNVVDDGENDLEIRLRSCPAIPLQTTADGVQFRDECMFRAAKMLPSTWHNIVGPVEGKTFTCHLGNCGLELVIEGTVSEGIEGAFNRIMASLEESRTNQEKFQREIQEKHDLWKLARASEPERYEQWVSKRIDQPYREWYEQSFVWNHRRIEYAVHDLYIRKKLKAKQFSPDDEQEVRAYLSGSLDMQFELIEQEFRIKRDMKRITALLGRHEEMENPVKWYGSYKNARMYEIWRKNYIQIIQLMFDQNKEMYLKLARS